MRSFVTATLVIGWKICYTEPENHPGDKRDAMLGYLQTIGEQFDWGGLLFALQRVLAAYALGDPTAKQMHRLSFNPLHHIDWMGLASMFICGFGWAKPVPVDMRYFKNPKAGMAATALAGPISNFLLAFVMLFLASLIYQAEQVGAVMVWVFYFLQTTAMLSIGLGLFNLLPIPPLDGSKVLFSLLPERAYYTLMRYERFGMLALLLLVWLDVGGGLLSQGIEAVFLWMAGLFFGH